MFDYKDVDVVVGEVRAHAAGMNRVEMAVHARADRQSQLEVNNYKVGGIVLYIEFTAKCLKT